MLKCGSQDKASGLKAIIAIHDTTLGPALGGTRMWTYATESEAIEDALRLARGMTYKNAAAGLNLGGGKTVIIGDPKKDKSEELFRATRSLGVLLDRHECFHRIPRPSWIDLAPQH